LGNVELVDDNFSDSLNIVFELNDELDFFFTADKIVDPISSDFSDFTPDAFLSFQRNSRHRLIQVRYLLFMAFNEVIDSRSLGSLVKD
jgi:hypothetical protein